MQATYGEYPFLGAALLFIATRAAESRIEAVAVERLLECLGLHHGRVQHRT